MTDWVGSLARAFTKHLETGGSGGSTGSEKPHASKINGLACRGPGTASASPVVSAVPLLGPRMVGTTGTSGSTQAVPRHDPGNAERFRRIEKVGTAGTSGTTKFAGDDLLTRAAFDTDTTMALDERAALVEDGTGAPREWCEGFARLDLAKPLTGFDERRWRTLIDDGGRFLDRWGAEAARLGWSAEDVFGVHPIAPGARYDAAGLVLLIDGGEVTDIDTRSASIRTKSSGATLVYLRTPRDGSIALWEMASIVVSTGGGPV
jgi:hypothetical protein